MAHLSYAPFSLFRVLDERHVAKIIQRWRSKNKLNM